MEVRSKRPQDVPTLLAIARRLPEWFNAQGLALMERGLAVEDGFVAEEESVAEEGGTPVGFVTWAPTEAPGEAELTWMAVARERHGSGIGTALCAALESDLRARGFATLMVSTLAETIEYAPYEATRRFYAGRGFRRVRVDPAFWGPENDRLLLRRDLVG